MGDGGESLGYLKLCMGEEHGDEALHDHVVDVLFLFLGEADYPSSGNDSEVI